MLYLTSVGYIGAMLANKLIRIMGETAQQLIALSIVAVAVMPELLHVTARKRPANPVVIIAMWYQVLKPMLKGGDGKFSPQAILIQAD